MKLRPDDKATQQKTARLRQQMHAKADELLDRMMSKTEDGRDTFDLDFTGREALAQRLGNELACMLLADHLENDRWRQRVQEASFWHCPRCGQQALRHHNEDGSDAYQDVQVKTRVGTLRLRLRQFRCGKCHKLFSPLPLAD